jgi:hypothetical protein
MKKAARAKLAAAEHANRPMLRARSKRRYSPTASPNPNVAVNYSGKISKAERIGKQNIV